MKRGVVAILAVLYISATTGATIHFHYCMGKLVNWNFRHKPSDICGKCGMKIDHNSKNNGCCKDEFRQVKNEQDQKLSQTTFELIQPICIVPSFFKTEIPSISLSDISETIPVSNAPPRCPGEIYICNCTFLI